LLRLAATAERGSEHPLGQAVVEAAQKRNIPMTQPQSFEAESGRGIRAIVEGKTLLVDKARPYWLAARASYASRDMC